MINMIKSRISSWKFAGLGIAIALYFVGVACTEPAQEKVTETETPKSLTAEKGEVFTVVDEPPTAINGHEAFIEELNDILEYPTASRRAGVEGKVFISFVVNTDGSLSDFVIMKGVNEEIDAEALRAVGELKNWNPGKNKGVTVRTKVVLPITFKLD